MPKLSIITVNLNNKVGLQKTIDSVITQTYKDFEWIIIDGGSTDGSKELIEKYSSYITYWISEPDKGIYNAMNKGIKVANGEYLQFLNSGDWLVDKRTLMRVFYCGYNTDIIYGNIKTIGTEIVDNYGLHSDFISCQDLINGTICHQACFIKRKIFLDNGLYDETYKIVSDWAFFLKNIVIKNCTVHYINTEIAYFDKNGVSSTYIKEREEERNKALYDIIPKRILEDYRLNLWQNEVRKYRFSRMLFSVLYRMVKWYERLKYNEKN